MFQPQFFFKETAACFALQHYLQFYIDIFKTIKHAFLNSFIFCHSKNI